MIFAEIIDKPRVDELLKTLQGFGGIEWADQGTVEEPDAYFWIYSQGIRVSVDNLTSLAFQVKCDQSNPLFVREVIEVLSRIFKINVFEEPEHEAHE